MNDILEIQEILLKPVKHLEELDKYIYLRRDKKRPLRRERTKLIEFLKYSVTEPVSNRLKSLPYNTYLGTVYWSLIRYLVLGRDKIQCSVCREKKSLQVHHLTYVHRGLEFRFLEDLTLLCSRCHSNIHKDPSYGSENWNTMRLTFGKTCDKCGKRKPSKEFMWRRKERVSCRKCLSIRGKNLTKKN